MERERERRGTWRRRREIEGYGDMRRRKEQTGIRDVRGRVMDRIREREDPHTITRNILKVILQQWRLCCIFRTLFYRSLITSRNSKMSNYTIMLIHPNL